MAIDLELNGQSITTTSATTAPAALTFETWTVTALAALIPTLIAGQTLSLVDATVGASSSQQAEIIKVTAANAGATSITVQRGADGTTPVAHANPSTFNIVFVASAFNPAQELAYAENRSATVTTCSGASLTYVFISGTGITVPVCPYQVTLEWDAFLQLTTTQPGLLYAAVQENTSGTAGGAICSSSKAAVPTNSGADSKILGNVPGRWRLGPTTTVRTFSLYLVALWDSTTGVFNCANSVINPSYLRAAVL